MRPRRWQRRNRRRLTSFQWPAPSRCCSLESPPSRDAACRTACHREAETRPGLAAGRSELPLTPASSPVLSAGASARPTRTRSARPASAREYLRCGWWTLCCPWFGFQTQSFQTRIPYCRTRGEPGPELARRDPRTASWGRCWSYSWAGCRPWRHRALANRPCPCASAGPSPPARSDPPRCPALPATSAPSRESCHCS